MHVPGTLARRKGTGVDEAIGPALDRVLADVDALLLDLDRTWAVVRLPRRSTYRRVCQVLRAHRAAVNMLVLIALAGIVIGWLVGHAGS